MIERLVRHYYKRVGPDTAGVSRAFQIIGGIKKKGVWHGCRFVVDLKVIWTEDWEVFDPSRNL